MEVNLTNFKLLHNYLISILSTNNYSSEKLPEQIMQYIGMIVQSQKHANMIEDFFDYFCENSGNKILKLTLEVEPLLSVKVLSMLFINLRSEFWISYLLCQPVIINSIQFQDIPKQEQWPQYYISLLKSLSIRLNNEHLSLFYNKKFSKFPLLYEALKYYNHPDCMVRTNVMNIILGIMKIKDQRLSKYFGRFPFTSYVLTYCCQVKDRISQFNKHLQKVSSQSESFNEKNGQKIHKSLAKSYYIDIIDYICYLNDLIELGPEQLAYFVRNSVLIYIVLPNLKYLGQNYPSLCISNTIFLIFTLFKTINDEIFKKTLCLMIMGKQLPSVILQKIVKNVDSEVYVPQVYSQQFLPNKYYWNKFDYQIQSQCVKLFDDIANFQTDHESLIEDLSVTSHFSQEINKISSSLGFNILTYQSYQNKVPLSELSYLLNFIKLKKESELVIKPNLKSAQLQLQDNPIRISVMKIFSNATSEICKDSVILCMAALINNFTGSEQIDNDVLKFSGLLMPCLDIKNYNEQFNLKQIDIIKQMVLVFVETINKNVKLGEEEEIDKNDDGYLFNITTIKNMLIMLTNSIYKSLQKNKQQILLKLYEQSLLQFKQIITKKNMKWIVEMFQLQYSKIGKQFMIYSNSLPQSILVSRKCGYQAQADQSSQDIDLISRVYFKTNKQKVKYFIQKFVLAQTFLFKYVESYIPKQQQNANQLQNLYMERFSSLYHEKYSKIEAQWKIGHSYQIGYIHIVECFSEQKKGKNTKKLMIVQDKCNLIIVEPSKEENSAKIIVNHPWKYLQIEIDRETAKKMSIKLSQCFKGDTRINLFFEIETSCAGTLEWMNSLKYERYQSEQAFILSYIRECLKKR